MSVLIDYKWAEPEPMLIAQELIELSYRLDHFIEPMTIAAEITREDIRENFQTATDPSGRAWDAWSDNYEPWALAHTTGPVFGDSANLHLTGDLYAGISDRSMYRPTDQELFLDVGNLPEYWAWNNFGAFERQTASRGTDEFGDIGGGDNPLPERPFIGLSTEAQAKIDATFFAWFEGEIQLAVSPLGKAFGRHSKRGGNLANVGQFSPRDS